MTPWLEFTAAIAWPVVTMIILITFRKSIISIFRKEEIIFSTEKGISIKLSSAKAQEALKEVFDEFTNVYYALLSEYERGIYANILAYKEAPKVKEVMPDFHREASKDGSRNQHLGCLRALRGIGLIQPEDNGSWDIEKRIVRTNFSKVLERQNILARGRVI